MKWLVLALASSACGGNPGTPDAAIAVDAPGAPGLDLGVTWTPVGYPTPTTAQLTAFYDPGYGRVVAVHRPWRESRATAGQVDSFSTARSAEAAMYGAQVMAGFGFNVDDPASDLTSDADPTNNTWTNATTRTAFCQMAVTWVTAHHPKYIFLGNEMDAYYRDHAADWPNWVSELAACRDAIHAASAQTIVFTTYQLELVKGQAAKTGTTRAADWQPVLDVESAVDAIGFTTYPFFQYEAPGDMPADYYSEIAQHTAKPVLFTEIGWTASPAVPYTGSETDQVDLITRFFSLTATLDLRYAVYLAENDFPTNLVGPTSAFYEIGLRDPNGVARAVDATWRAAVTANQRP